MSRCVLGACDGERGAEDGAARWDSLPSRNLPVNEGGRHGARSPSPTFAPAAPELQKTYSSWKQTLNAG